MFEVKGWLKVSTEDHYEDGCEIGGDCYYGGGVFVGQTIDELIAKLMEFAGVSDKDAVIVNACGEAGRVDIQVMENFDGHCASERELERFRVGETRLWLADYTFYVERVIRKVYTIPADLDYESN